MSSEALGAGLVTETLCVLETNLDDLSPQIVAYAFEELLASGALDVWSCPVQMKKGRTGVVLSALCDPETVARLAEVLFKETTSLGVRVTECHRVSLPRKVTNVNTRWGPVRVKVGMRETWTTSGAEETNVHPEYDDCAAAARTHGVPLKNVFRSAVDAYFARNPQAE